MKNIKTTISKYDIYKYTPIEIYDLVRSGKLKKFPMGFWKDPESDYYAPEITRYLIETILCWDDDDIKLKLRKRTFDNHKLGGLILNKYNDSPYAAITKAYPEKNFRPWEFVSCPNGYWQGSKGKENAIAATKWLIEEKLKWSHADIIEKLNIQVFFDNSLIGMFKIAFGSSLYNTMECTYPGEFQRWELGGHVQNKTWNRTEGILAVKWLIADRLKWNDEDIKNNYSKQIYDENNLNGMLQMCFNGSPYQALNSAYPNKFKCWELPCVPQGFWNSKENCIAALKWVVKNKFNMQYDLARKKLTRNILYEYRLYGLYANYSMSQIKELLLKG